MGQNAHAKTTVLHTRLFSKFQFQEGFVRTENDALTPSPASLFGRMSRARRSWRPLTSVYAALGRSSARDPSECLTCAPYFRIQECWTAHLRRLDRTRTRRRHSYWTTPPHLRRLNLSTNVTFVFELFWPSSWCRTCRPCCACPRWGCWGKMPNFGYGAPF